MILDNYKNTLLIFWLVIVSFLYTFLIRHILPQSPDYLSYKNNEYTIFYKDSERYNNNGVEKRGGPGLDKQLTIYDNIKEQING